MLVNHNVTHHIEVLLLDLKIQDSIETASFYFHEIQLSPSIFSYSGMKNNNIIVVYIWKDHNNVMFLSVKIMFLFP